MIQIKEKGEQLAPIITLVKNFATTLRWNHVRYYQTLGIVHNFVYVLFTHRGVWTLTKKIIEIRANVSLGSITNNVSLAVVLSS